MKNTTTADPVSPVNEIYYLSRMISITLSIVILTAIISFTAFSKEKIKEDLLFWPAEIDSRKQYYRFITCGLVHGDLMHLAFNMISLMSFGEFLEINLFSHPTLFGGSGKIVYLALYISALIVSVIPDYFQFRNNYSYRALGASGAVSAVIFSAILLNPSTPIRLMFIPIDIPGYIFGFIFLGLSAYLARRGGDNIGHRAHFSGAIYGVIFTIVMAKWLAHYDVIGAFVETIKARY
ncbi:rhomboid family intramembrane serine protease [Flavihumibacter profundi]|uniref:rhomboid family intramembrane serine protease n=1 Tax=Flavihumibacter profundi TaxID=2716883 RepID=UPI001CC45F00|nr:rhomboid family intramembrane serine protease [Flavihumibacter profundi]MBZ5856439.1 rhomboid family intramembrane serine protease [Flavihumibacter profundi]